MAEAFTAGVRPGGLTDDTQIRMLLCYLVKVAGPVKRETMQGALLQEQLVNYFEFADALAEVEKQQLVTVDEDGRYTITRRGTTVADTLAYDLPRTVRESAIRRHADPQLAAPRRVEPRRCAGEGRPVQRGLLDCRHGQRCVPHGAGHAG